MLRYAIYNRVSTEDQCENGVSLEAMENACRAFITSQGGQLVKIYTDVKSGGNLLRPHIQELIADIKSNIIPIDIVLVWRLDRLSRNQVETLKLIDFFNKHKVAFRSVTEPFDTATPLGQAMLGMLSTFAQFERKSIGQRTKNAMASKAATKRMGGYAPLGYRLEPDGKLSPDPKESRIVTLIFRHYRKGLGVKQIADLLNKKKLKTRNGAHFHPETVRRILHNPVYRGDIVWDRQGLNISGATQHTRLVTPKEFQSVQQEIKKRQSLQKTTVGSLSPTVIFSSGVVDSKSYICL